MAGEGDKKRKESGQTKDTEHVNKKTKVPDGYIQYVKKHVAAINKAWVNHPKNKKIVNPSRASSIRMWVADLSLWETLINPDTAS